MIPIFSYQFQIITINVVSHHKDLFPNYNITKATMIMKQTVSFLKQAITKRLPLRSYFSNEYKENPQTIIKSQPKGVVQDAIRAQTNLVEGYDAGLNNFISKVYATTGYGMVLTALGAALAGTVPYFAIHPFRSMGYGFIGTVVGLSSAYMLNPKTVSSQADGMTKLYTQNNLFRIGLFSLGWLSNGIMFMPIVNMLSSMFPLILPSFAMLAVGCFGGASLAIKLLPKHYLTRYSGLIGGLGGGLLGLGALSFFKSFYGQLYKTSGIPMLDTTVGLSIFLILTLYNTRQAVKSYKNGKADHIATSIAFLYNILQSIRRGLWWLVRK